MIRLPQPAHSRIPVVDKLFDVVETGTGVGPANDRATEPLLFELSPPESEKINTDPYKHISIVCTNKKTLFSFQIDSII